MNKNDIGARLRKARRAAGLTQAELGKAAHVRIATICQIERGQVDPRFSTCKAIAGALGLALEIVARDDDNLSEP